MGELYLWSMLHQLCLGRPFLGLSELRKLCKPELFGATPKLGSFYARLEQEPKVQRVLSGDSSFGALQQYFVNPE